MDANDLYVVLGCYGRRTDNFVSCPSTKNGILKVDVTLEHYAEMMDYFEGCRLYDKPMYDFNAVRNFLQSMQNRFNQVTKPLWAKKDTDLYQNFVMLHRACGVYICLELVSKSEQQAEEEPEKIEIKSTKQNSAEPQTGQQRSNLLRLIRTKS